MDLAPEDTGPSPHGVGATVEAWTAVEDHPAGGERGEPAIRQAVLTRYT